MNRSLRVLVPLLLLGAPAWAHGGFFPPPPPVRRGPAAPTSALASQPAAPSSAAGLGASATDLDAWNWWWELHKEGFLRVRTHVLRSAVRTGADAGRGPSRRPASRVVYERILPALREALGTTESNDMRTACLIALARLGNELEDPLAGELEGELSAYLGAPNQEVAETAALALGILGRRQASLALGELLLDRPAGRKRIGSQRVPARTRAFAAYALGLLGRSSENEDVRRYVVQRLTQALETGRGLPPDVGVACVLAIGHTPLAFLGKPQTPAVDPPPTAGRRAQVAFLLERFESSDTDRLERAHIPTAIGRLLQGELAPTLRARAVRALLEPCRRVRRTPREVVASCVQTLGILTDPDAAPLADEVRALLSDIEDVTRGKLARHQALISLARLAGRAQDPGGESVLEVRRHLLSQAVDGSNQTRRFAGLALALLERAMLERGHAPARESALLLRRRLVDAVSPSDVGAAATACGLLGDPIAVPELLAKLEQVADDAARGAVATALGLVGARAALPAVRRMVAGATYRPTLLRDGSAALALLGDRDSSALLVARLIEARSLAAQASIAQALGRVGDASAVGPLIEVLGDERRSERARAFAAAALGLIADRDELPWNTSYAVGSAYGAAPPTLLDRSGFGLLNIL